MPHRSTSRRWRAGGVAPGTYSAFRQLEKGVQKPRWSSWFMEVYRLFGFSDRWFSHDTQWGKLLLACRSLERTYAFQFLLFFDRPDKGL